MDLGSDVRIGSLPALRLYNPPIVIAEMIEEINHASPKQVIFLDSRPLLNRGVPGAVNWVDSTSIPNVIVVFLNPETATAPVVAHELNHVFIDFFLGYEDRRRYFDPNHRQMDFMVNFIQSIVIDCKVLQQLKWRRGLDLSQFRYDIVAAAVELIQPLGQGMMHQYRYTDIVAACSLAVPTAFPDLYELDEADRTTIRSLWDVIDQYEPKLAIVAKQMTQALLKHGYETQEGAVRAIDACLTAAFGYLKVDFDPQKHLEPRVMEMAIIDKMPHFIPGAPIPAKYGLLRHSILTRRHILSAQNRTGHSDVALEIAPPGVPFSALNLPKIERPAMTHPAQYTKIPLHSIQAILAQNFAKMTALADSGADAFKLSDDLNIYEQKYVFTENCGRHSEESPHVLLP